jgi:FkbM family methyltransferase
MTVQEEILDYILKKVFGPVIPGGQAMQVAARRLAEPPNNEAARTLAAFCQQFANVYKGWNYNIEANGERWLLRQLAAFQPAVVFDVGANEGDWLAAVLQELPTARVHAFEIVEATSAKLLQRMKDEPRAVINRFGLSDQAGTITVRAFTGSSTLASSVAYPHGEYREVMCPVRAGDEYLREQGIECIDFLKLDVEGAERPVLQGLSQTLDAGQIDVIQFEYGKVVILTHFLLKDFYDLLEGKGYALGKLYPDHVDFRAYKLEDEDFLGPNYVAVRRARADIIRALSKP